MSIPMRLGNSRETPTPNQGGTDYPMQSGNFQRLPSAATPQKVAANVAVEGQNRPISVSSGCYRSLTATVSVEGLKDVDRHRFGEHRTWHAQCPRGLQSERRTCAN